MIRLSSLGDVILATAALEPYRARGEKVDWLVAREYAELLKGHPAIGQVWEFDRRGGLQAWVTLCRRLAREGYTEILDLHESLRTWLFRFLLLAESRKPPRARPRWVRFGKPRIRTMGYVLFHRFWPRWLRPGPVVSRFARAAGGAGTERPDLGHLIDPELKSQPSKGERLLAVMPSSLWKGKCWPVSRYVALLREMPEYTPVILGTEQDEASRKLVQALESEGLVCLSRVGAGSLRESAWAIAQCEAYLGSDTGLAHLAEALGVPAWVIFGPTTPELGFGPWRPRSLAIETSLNCRPCGKDGRRCIRVHEPYACMNRLHPAEVLRQIRTVEGGVTSRELSDGRLA